LLTWLLGQQVHGAEIMDIANIIDIANIANIAKEAGRRNIVEMGGCVLGVTEVSCNSTPPPFKLELLQDGVVVVLGGVYKGLLRLL